MAIYEGFARIYARGIWVEYSRWMAALFPEALRKFNLSPETLLDVACGEGTFAIAAARMGLKVTGVDLSDKMLELAREKVLNEKLDIDFIHGDMRDLPFRERFDLATCWFDSLNYLLDASELEKAFASIWLSLKPGGHFIFDMNTIYGLMTYSMATVSFQQEFTITLHDSPDLFVLSRPEYDFEKDTSTWRITGFEKEGEAWHRVDEEHRERGYRLDEIAACFSRAGFTELGRTDFFPEIHEVKPESKRVWFVLRKPG